MLGEKGNLNAAFVTQAAFKLLGSSDPPASVSQVAGTTGIYYHTQVRKGQDPFLTEKTVNF
jgi:hypothetical protein